MSVNSDVIARRAEIHDLGFVTADGYVSPEIVQRKILAGEVFVAEMDGSQVAYLRLEYLWSMLPYISLIRVLKDHRGHGVGRVLLSHVERELGKVGHAVLFSSSQANEPEPQAWHRHMGFQECGILAGINEGGVGEVFFRKGLE